MADNSGTTKYWIWLLDEYKISGDALYYGKGVVVLPYGTVSIEETKAPTSYL